MVKMESTKNLEPQKVEIPAIVYGLLGLILILLFIISFIMILIGVDVSQTNILLSSFQRMDAVVDMEKNNNATSCSDGFVLINNVCYQTIKKVRHVQNFAYDEQSDPNLCKQWKTICEDGPVGPQCDVICKLGE